MVLPLYLALTAAEISEACSTTFPWAYMACHFSPYTEGISNIPDRLPEGSLLILNDRLPCQGHSASLVARQLADVVAQHSCESVLLDFQRPREPESEAMVSSILQALSCPVAVTEQFAENRNCPVFLSPAPLYLTLSEYLAPWQGREIWLEAALCQEELQITESGMTYRSIFPTEHLEGGLFCPDLCCRYHTKILDNTIRFTLFDTTESLETKLQQALDLGVTRAVGLWQELGNLLK